MRWPAQKRAVAADHEGKDSILRAAPHPRAADTPISRDRNGLRDVYQEWAVAQAAVGPEAVRLQGPSSSSSLSAAVLVSGWGGRQDVSRPNDNFFERFNLLFAQAGPRSLPSMLWRRRGWTRAIRCWRTPCAAAAIAARAVEGRREGSKARGFGNWQTLVDQSRQLSSIRELSVPLLQF